MLRARVAFVLGIVMIGLGIFVALRPLWRAPPLTRSVLLDVAFAAFFVLRGTLNLRSARRGP
jgi:hypothetical protein